MRTLESLGEVRAKTVLVRCDFNVPLRDGKIADDGRIRASLNTIRHLRRMSARVVLISHLGRPAGQRDDRQRYTLRPVAARLAELLDVDVKFTTEVTGEATKDAVASLGNGEVLLCENLRFHPGETSKNASERRAFARQLAAVADAFVSDGFGVMHRTQASVYELAQLLPSAAGRLVEAELTALRRLSKQPKRPYTVVLGGSKVSDKLGVITRLIERVDTLLIGGGMLFTFLAAQGLPVGASLVERDQIDTVRGYLAEAERRGVRIVLPRDVVVAQAFAADAAFEVVPGTAIESSAFGAAGIGLDIGPASASEFARHIAEARTVFWNGPMGVFEMSAFADGTRRVAHALTETHGFTVVGGGDSAAAVRALGFSDQQFGHVSTGGGASLEYLEGKTLPGVEVLG